MKEKTSYRLKTIGGVGLAAAISVGAISDNETGDPFAFAKIAGDYIEKVPELSVDFIQSNNCERTLPESITNVRNLIDEAKPETNNEVSNREFAKKAAREQGLTIVDETSFNEKIDKADSTARNFRYSKRLFSSSFYFCRDA